MNLGFILTCNTREWSVDLRGTQATLYRNGEKTTSKIDNLPPEVLQVLITERYIVWKE